MNKPHKVQVAFQGGGAKIFALLAAAEVLSEMAKAGDIEIVRVAGTSAGAIIATGFGWRLDFSELRTKIVGAELESCFPPCSKLKIFWKFFRNKPLYPENSLKTLLSDLLGIKPELTFADMEAKGGPKVVLTKSNVVARKQECTNKEDYVIASIMDSCAIPFVFRTTYSGPVPWFDGGITGNLPTKWLDGDVPIIAVMLDQAYDEESVKRKFGLLKAMLDSAVDVLVHHDSLRKGVSSVRMKTNQVSLLDFGDAHEILAAKDQNKQYDALKADAREKLKQFLSEPNIRFRWAEERYNQLKSIYNFMKPPKDSCWVIHAEDYAKEETSLYETLKTLRNRITEIAREKGITLKAYPTQKSFDAIMRPDIALAREKLKQFLSEPNIRFRWAEERYNQLKSIYNFMKPPKDSCWVIHAEDYAKEETSLYETLKTLRNRITEIAREKGITLKAYPTQKSFDAIMRPDIALANKVIYTFPFFLSHIRLSTWDVVDYGVHQALGVLVRENTYSANLLKNYMRDLNTLQKAEHYDGHWISKLLHVLDKFESRLVSMSGYLYNEIVPLMIHKSDDASAQDWFVQAGDTKQQSDFISGDVFSGADSKENDVFVIDLADSKYFLDVAKNKDSRFILIPLLHDLEIPVGIGYSLLMFEEMRDKILWQGFRDAAEEVLRESGADFKKIGISLTI